MESKLNYYLEFLSKVSADTMAITALPLDCWLKERLKNWVQLSGHEGSIVPATDRTLWKRRSCIGYNEGDAYERLSKDALLVGLIPKFYQQREYKDEKFIEIEDLTSGFRNPAVMDVKMGTRTFLECEVKNEKLRSDLYEKMIAIDANEPTEEEHLAKAITKLRYMQFRESESSTATLGFRIEAAKTPDDILKKSFKKVKTKEEVMAAFMAFFGRKSSTLCPQLLVRLRQIRDAIERSTFFKHHEVVGSSLLFVYDENNVGVWMIDFAKTLPIEGRVISHRIPWKMGNHEDGYLIGLNSLIEIFEELSQKR
ncbi:hypothetical protein AB6A40_000586 [Gnathostoma spinigerum]|uniref:Kinase n=1 Tax=Gnathostoma spinigerum TaxID=75299 RepID=A0ABD6EB17_9BILA